jgi:hypothetical protein
MTRTTLVFALLGVTFAASTPSSSTSRTVSAGPPASKPGLDSYTQTTEIPVEFITFPSVASPTPTVLGPLIGKASIIGVTDGKSTWQYTCDKPVPKTTTMCDPDSGNCHNACAYGGFPEMTYIHGPGSYGMVSIGNWNVRETEDRNGFTTTTDSVSHTVSLTERFECQVRNRTYTPCYGSFTASPVNDAERAQLSSMNAQNLDLSNFQATQTETYREPFISLGPVPVIGVETMQATGVKPGGPKSSGASPAETNIKKNSGVRTTERASILGSAIATVTVILLCV